MDLFEPQFFLSYLFLTKTTTTITTTTTLMGFDTIEINLVFHFIELDIVMLYYVMNP